MGSLKLRVTFDTGTLDNIVRKSIAINLASSRAASEVVNDMYHVLRDQIGSDLQEPKSGELWNRSHPKFHRRWRNAYSNRSAAPGEAPAYQTGSLFDSIEFVRKSANSGYLEVTSGYGAYQEFGDWTSWYGNKVPAHPFVRPAIAKSLKKFNEVAVTAYRRETGL